LSDNAEAGSKGIGVFSGYYIYDSGTSPNGEFNCLFNALAHQLNRPLSEAAQIRQELVRYLEENASSFPDLVCLLLKHKPFKSQNFIS